MIQPESLSGYWQVLMTTPSPGHPENNKMSVICSNKAMCNSKGKRIRPHISGVGGGGEVSWCFTPSQPVQLYEGGGGVINLHYCE